MGASGLPNINEVAAFLHFKAPAVKARLEQEEGGIPALLQLGVEGGFRDEVGPELESGLRLRAKVTLEALGEALPQARAAEAQLAQQLHRLRRLKFAAAVLAAVGASSVIPAAFVGRAATIAAGLLALFATIVQLAAEILVLGPGAKEADLIERSAALRQAQGESLMTYRLLQAHQSTPVGLDELKRVLSDANDLFGRLIQLLAKHSPPTNNAVGGGASAADGR